MNSHFYKYSYTFYLLLLLIVSLSLTAYAGSSPLAKGKWYKVGVSKQGIYKLPYKYLREKGIIDSGTDPQYIRIYGQGGGMLPQANALSRPDGLQENAIFIAGEQDGEFNPQDYILFYAQGPDKIRYNTELQDFEYEKNLYSDTVYYFLTVSSEKGKRINSLPDKNVKSPLVTQYNAFSVVEEDRINLLSSGRRWFGESLPYNSTSSFQFPLFDLSDDEPLTIHSAFVSTNTESTTVQLNVNGYLAQPLKMPAIKDPQKNPYADKGAILEETLEVKGSDLKNHGSLSVQLKLESSSTGRSVYLDYLSVSAICALKYRDEPLFFRATQSLAYPESRFEVGGGQPGLLVWDITNPHEVFQQLAQIQNSKLSFGASTHELKEYLVFDPAKAKEPVSIKEVANQNLRGDLSPELLIVSHPSLSYEANRLANFRQQQDRLQVKVVTPEQIYNEFSSGAQDVSAIRDYMRYLYQKGGGKLRYLLLFGRGSYDYKKRNNPDHNLVPVYESYNSTHPIFSYTSDDYFGFLEDDEGSWEETRNVSHSLEIGIGRLPAKNLKEAQQLVDKLIRYQTHPSTEGSWRTTVLLIADDEDNNLFHRDSEQLSEDVQERWPMAQIDKIYLGAYPQETSPSGERSPAAIDAIEKAIERGALFVNYIGHGSSDLLTAEYVITKTTFDKWQNQNRLPVFVTATCEFGQHDIERTSGAEHLLLRPDGGAIGLVTASRPVYSNSNLALNRDFYESALPTSAGTSRRLGDIIKLTKNKGAESTGVANRSFLLLGDPAMPLAYPAQEISVKELEVEESGHSAYTISTFSKVKVTGAVLNTSGQSDTNFNGLMEAVVYEKPFPYETTDPKTQKMSFTIQNKTIFRGKAVIKEGAFTFNFVVPKSIRYNFGNGKISLYAVDTTRQTDATGYYNQFLIGGSSPFSESDKTPPRVSLYLNDSSFVNGEKVGQKSLLLAYFHDENGINIMSDGVSGGITATLDGQTSFELNEYYVADVGTYKKGSLQYPLESLLPGRHTLTLTARDSYNNISKNEISFVVSGENDFQVYQLYNYPNPFREKTRFVVEHSRAGEDIETALFIYDLKGQLINQQKQVFPQSLRKLELEEWDRNSKNAERLTPGVYLFKILLRSLIDGSTAEKTKKLVILP